ncbi:protealysin inhibitor emfourin [Nocardioides acrostichi]|uniref:Neutral metalloproteinase n=1 Tax=Nocardioides acrostichi TaxID=2784339 RepID=A0A930V1F3_9ACTN|nr:protealysin inhibitor emfourin [Nocardioides acrostichi]MBF4161464.1 M4 family metallopeptidase [Nocardioides acrostichi]
MTLGPAQPHPRCTFVPPFLQERLGRAGALGLDGQLRGTRPGPAPAQTATVTPGPAWVVHTAAGSTTLPGQVVRAAGEAESGDAAVDEAAVGITGSLALYAEVWGRDSFDGAGAPVVLTVHYGQDYDNAFWNGTQLVFGDGDGQVFDRFTKPVDVLGHEFTHAVTERTAGLTYEGQSGALNESMSDVAAACLKQRLRDQSPAEADWLIGEGIFLPGVQGRALRDMANPGTAYDDPKLGQDPQVGHMRDYVDTTDDNGGVHLNSGIPNKAFQLAALAVGGTSWEGAGRIWYDALIGGQVGPDADFAAFAAATVAAAGEHADAVAGAWRQVGVEPGAATTVPSSDTPAARSVRVRRTGGFAGQVAEGVVDLDSDDPRVPEAIALCDRVSLLGLTPAPPQPDRYVYEMHVRGVRARVAEQQLTEELEQLVALVLRP